MMCTYSVVDPVSSLFCTLRFSYKFYYTCVCHSSLSYEQG